MREIAKPIIYILLIFVLFHSCARGPEVFFKCEMQELNEKARVEKIMLKEVEGTGINTMSDVVKDSIALSLEPTGGYLFSISNVMTGKFLGQFCKQGKSAQEILSAIPVKEIYESDGEDKACVYSYMDSKVCIWNITKSLDAGKDVYDKVVTLKGEGNYEFLALKSCYYLGDGKILACNSNQNPESDELLDVPVYEIYDMSNGEQKVVLEGMFEKIEELPVRNTLFSPKEYFSGVDCISPDRSRLVYAMSYFPCFFIFDINSGATEGFRFTGCPSFSPERKIWYFTSVQSDENFIYALYYGKEIDYSDYDACPDILYVFDWSGNVRCKFLLDRHFTDLSVDTDSGKLYFTHRMMSRMYYVDLESFKGI